MTNRVTLGGIAAVIVLLAGCVGAPIGAVNGQDTPTGTESTVAVSATGSVTGDPDLSVIHVSVVATASTASAAREQVATDSQRMRQAIRELGIEDAAVETAYFSLSPRYDREREAGPVGFRATHAYRIEASVDQAGAVIDAAVENGADQVGGVSFTLTDATRSELRSDALTAAMDRARSEADTLATAADVSVIEVRSISTNSGGYIPFEGAIERAGADGAITIESGPVTVSATVSVVYTIG